MTNRLPDLRVIDERKLFIRRSSSRLKRIEMLSTIPRSREIDESFRGGENALVEAAGAESPDSASPLRAMPPCLSILSS
jgi:hypothetical protein